MFSTKKQNKSFIYLTQPTCPLYYKHTHKKRQKKIFEKLPFKIKKIHNSNERMIFGLKYYYCYCINEIEFFHAIIFQSYILYSYFEVNFNMLPIIYFIICLCKMNMNIKFIYVVEDMDIMSIIIYIGESLLHSWRMPQKQNSLSFRWQQIFILFINIVYVNSLARLPV